MSQFLLSMRTGISVAPYLSAVLFKTMFWSKFWNTPSAETSRGAPLHTERVWPIMSQFLLSIQTGISVAPYLGTVIFKTMF